MTECFKHELYKYVEKEKDEYQKRNKWEETKRTTLCPLLTILFNE